MRTFTQVLILAVGAILSCCLADKNQKKRNNINRVVLATGGCYGNCPIQVIDLDSTLTVRFQGIKYSDNLGFYTGKITQQFWDTLNAKFESIHYTQLDSLYQQSVDDLSTEVIVFYKGNKLKRIVGQSTSLPDSVMTVYQWLMLSIEKFDLRETQDSLIFPTRIEKPIPEQVLIKFIPPKADN
jgi:hypothetical protein